MPKADADIPPLRLALKKGTHQPRRSILRAFRRSSKGPQKKHLGSNGAVLWWSLPVGASQAGNNRRAQCA